MCLGRPTLPSPTPGRPPRQNRMLTVRRNTRAASHQAYWTPTAWFTRQGAPAQSRATANSVTRASGVWEGLTMSGQHGSQMESLAPRAFPTQTLNTANHKANQLLGMSGTGRAHKPRSFQDSRSQCKGTGEDQGDSNGTRRAS